MTTKRLLRLLPLLALLPSFAAAQQGGFTRADTLRGSITPERAWWNVLHYDLALRVSPSDSTIAGSNTIRYAVTAPSRDLQIDLAAGMTVDSVVQDGVRLAVRRDGDAMFVTPAAPQAVGSQKSVTVHYRGRPRVAANAPWDGGFVWARDRQGNPWIGTAVQGIGASVWWPNKDHQSAEPDSMRIRVTVPDPLVEVSNGRLEGVVRNTDGTSTYTWRVSNPINNYSVTLNVGNYVHFGEQVQGEAGPLDLDYWVLAPNLPAARRHFEQVKPMLRCFEGWFGPYPFYEDGFKMVETPYLGMEHQSAIAYGNGYRNGYLGNDLSGTGLGLSWDYIIVHEAAHEWFGNNITTNDIADMWVHEGFAAYAEGLYVECLQGKEAGAAYVRGTRAMIDNVEPVVGPYGVNQKGGSDMYPKGANVLHTIRQVLDDDARWRSTLRGLNETFRHGTVTTADVEDFLARGVGRDLSRVFDQYLRHANLPVLEYALRGNTLSYRWRANVDGFDLPVRVTVGRDRFDWIHPKTGEWSTTSVELGAASDFRIDPNFYVGSQAVAGPGR